MPFEFWVQFHPCLQLGFCLALINLYWLEKELDQIGKYIFGKFDRLLVSSDKNGLLLDTHQLSKKLTLLGIHNEPVESIMFGIKKIKQIIRESGVALIFGTHYIAEEIFLEFEISFDTEII